MALTRRLPCYFPSTIPQDTSQGNHDSLLQTCVCQQIDGVADNAKKRKGGGGAIPGRADLYLLTAGECLAVTGMQAGIKKKKKNEKKWMHFRNQINTIRRVVPVRAQAPFLKAERTAERLTLACSPACSALPTACTCGLNHENIMQ